MVIVYGQFITLWLETKQSGIELMRVDLPDYKRLLVATWRDNI